MSFARLPDSLRRGAAAGVAALVLLAGAARAEVTANIAMADGSLSTIRMVALPNQLYSGGFLPVRVRIENRAGEVRTWRVTFAHGNAVGGRNALESVFAFTVPATTSQETVVFVPAGTVGQLRGTIDGPDVANDHFMLPFASAGFRNWNTHVVALTSLMPAVSKLAAAEIVELKKQAAARTPTTRAGSRFPTRVSPGMINSVLDSITYADPAQWPADWRTWSQFKVMLAPEAAWQVLDPARQRALREWIALGGRLVLLPEREGRRTEVPHGLGLFRTLAKPLEETGPMELSRALTNSGAPPGTMQAFWHPPELVEKSDPLLDLKIGGRWLVGFLIGFGLLVGPVNLFYLAPVGRRHRLFLTIPLMSLCGAVVLIAVVFISDGFGGRGHRQALVVLLPTDHEAVVLQRQVSRTGMIFRRGFALSADTDLQRRSDTGAQSVELWRHGTAVGGDWFTSRSVQYHDLRRITPTRARIDLVEGGQAGRAPVLQSSVGATLKSVRYLDVAGNYWKADELPPGRRVTLEPTGDRPAYGAMSVTLSRGCFFAEGGPGDLAPIPTLASIHWTDQAVHFTGRLEEASP